MTDEIVTPGALATQSDRMQLLADRPSAFMRQADWQSRRDIQLRDYWRITRNHGKKVAAIIGLSMFVACALLLLMPDYYRATARIEVSPVALSSEITSRPMDADGALDYPVYLNTQVQFVKSPALLNRVAEALDLEQDPTFLRHMAKEGHLITRLIHLMYLGPREQDDRPAAEKPLLTPALQPSISLAELAHAHGMLPLVTDMQKKLRIEQVKAVGTVSRETHLIDLTYQDRSPRLATRIANAVADALVLLNRENKAATYRATNQFLTEQAEDIQGQISNREQALLAYAKTHEILSLDPSENTALDRLGALNKELVEAENDRRVAEAAYHAFSDPKAAEAAAEQDAKQIVEARANLAALRTKRAQLLVGTTDKWPETQQVDQQIAELEKYLGETSERATEAEITNLETHYRQALEHEQSLRKAFDQQRAVMLSQNEAAVTYRLMQQESASYKTLLNDLLSRQGAIDVELANSANNVRVVNYASVPDLSRPSGPLRSLWLLLVAVLSTGLAVVTALICEHWDNTLRSTEDIEAALHLRTLGAIPSVDGPRDRLPSPNGLHLHDWANKEKLGLRK
ncbi:MAG TPA: GumC family protein [Candidatus Acidoferrales bacterium]|nr:GumC family protein [Candidatus Acidoferrales bacterium]